MVQLALVIVTAFPPFNPRLGEPVWHHNASLAAALLFTAATWRWQTRNRMFLAIGVLATTVLATVSGFLLLYLKQDLKDWVLKDWAKFWHIAWSWVALVFFLAHTWINRGPLLGFYKQARARLGGRLLHDGTLLLILAAIPLTWSPWGADVLQKPQYIPWTLYTWLIVAGGPYLAWAWSRWRLAVASPPAWAESGRVQRATDLALFPMTILANVSGFPLLYFNTKETSLKYVAKYWHTWPSIAFAVLIFAHSIHRWNAVRAHWRRVDDALAPSPGS